MHYTVLISPFYDVVNIVICCLCLPVVATYIYVCSLCLFSDGLLGYIVIFIELQYS